MSKKKASAAGKSERRAQIARSNLYEKSREFPAFMDLPAEQFLALMKSISKEPYQLTALASFVDKYRVSISELTIHDVRAVRELDCVRRIMDERDPDE